MKMNQNTFVNKIVKIHSFLVKENKNNLLAKLKFCNKLF